MRIERMGVPTHVVRQGEGREILLLHGWGCDVSLFAPVMEALAPRARLTALDFPAHGESGRPPEVWGIPEYAAHTLEIMDALEIETCDVIAHSFGCRVTLWLAAHHPERFGRLVLTGAAGIRPPETKEAKGRQSAYRTLRRAAEAAGRFGPLAGLSRRAREALVQRYGSRDYAALDDFMRGIFREVVNLDLRPCLREIRSSTLLFWGDQDQETPLWMARVMEEEIPDAGLVIAEGAGHYAYLEQLGLFLRVCESFLLGVT